MLYSSKVQNGAQPHGFFFGVGVYKTVHCKLIKVLEETKES